MRVGPRKAMPRKTYVEVSDQELRTDEWKFKHFAPADIPRARSNLETSPRMAK